MHDVSLFLSWSYIIVLNDLITKNECCFFLATLMKAHYCFQNVTRNILCHKEISFSLVSFSCNVFVLNYLPDLLYFLVLVSKTSFVSIQLYFTCYYKENPNMYPNFLAQAGLDVNA